MSYKFSSIKLKNFGRQQNGVAAVELAIILIPLLLIVAGVVEFGRTFWYYDALAKATRDGARLMSRADKDAIADAKEAAEDLVVYAAGIDGAKVSPVLTSVDNVLVECLNASYVSQGCTNGTAPIHVRVSIVNFSVDIGEWIPFITESGATGWNDIALSPSTTMRYLCTDIGSC
jgi:Flp pilus assembly pilin Flp